MKRILLLSALCLILLPSCSRRADLPVGVFDSGTGGLTVLEKILTLDEYDNADGERRSDGIPDFAAEDFSYLADQANMPYGVYDSEGKSDLLRALVREDARFLLSDSYFADAGETIPSGRKKPCKILVIACNTATAYGLEDVREMLEARGDGTRVIGVIHAGVKAALDCLDTCTAPYAVGVLATPGTISSGAYERTIRLEAAARGRDRLVSVVNQSGYGFAEAVDSDPSYVDASLTAPRPTYLGPRLGGEDASIRPELLDVYRFDPAGMLTDASGVLQLNSAANYARFNLVSLVERHRASGSSLPLKAIILGCTHYPFQLETLQRVVGELRGYCRDGVYPYRDLLAEDLVFIDPAHYVALECYQALKADGLLASRPSRRVDGFISVPCASLDSARLTPEGLLRYEYKYGRDASDADFGTRAVPFSLENVGAPTRERIRALLPACAREIAVFGD